MTLTHKYKKKHSKDKKGTLIWVVKRTHKSVSYTHLDVYKRQATYTPALATS